MPHFLFQQLPAFNTPDAGAGGTPQPPEAPQDPAWISPTLPPETREFLTGAEYGKNETPEAALIHLSQLARAQAAQGTALFAPKDENDTAALDNIYKALGRPETADKYEIKFPDGYTPHEKMAEFARSTAFKLGADGKKAQEMVDGFLAIEKDIVAGVTKGVNEHNAAAMAELEKEYGAGFAKAQADGQRAMQAMGLTEADLAFFDANKGSATISRILAKIGAGMTENGGVPPTPPGAQTVGQAQQALKDFQNSPEYIEVAKVGPRHQNYRATMDRLDELGAKAYPTRRA